MSMPERDCGGTMSEEAIRERAYALWEQDGRPEGRSLVHWSQAESEIGAEQPAAAPSKPKLIKSQRRRKVTKTVH